jgi:hypothetical protein
MVRPTLLVAEPEPEQALSVRKLVLETAKFNVLTAHSTAEALELLQMFPKIQAAVLVRDSSLDCEAIAASAKRNGSKLPVIAVVPQIAQRCEGADHHVPSHEPEKLVELVRSLLGDPRQIDGVNRRGAAPKKKPEPTRRTGG